MTISAERGIAMKNTVKSGKRVFRGSASDLDRGYAPIQEFDAEIDKARELIHEFGSNPKSRVSQELVAFFSLVKSDAMKYPR